MVIQVLRDLIITFFDWRALRNSHSDVIETEGWRIAVTAGSVRKSPYYARCPSQRYRSVVHRKQYFHGAVCYYGSMELVCSLALYVFGIIADFRFRSGLWQKCPYACHPITLASASVPSIIDYHELYDYHIERFSNTGPAHLASFFRFENTGKQYARVFLSSILVQLSNQSVPFRISFSNFT